MARRRQICRTAHSKQYRHNQDITARTPVPPLVQSKGAKQEEGYKREAKKQVSQEGKSTKDEMGDNQQNGQLRGRIIIVDLTVLFPSFALSFLLSFFPIFFFFFFECENLLDYSRLQLLSHASDVMKTATEREQHGTLESRRGSSGW